MLLHNYILLLDATFFLTKHINLHLKLFIFSANVPINLPSHKIRILGVFFNSFLFLFLLQVSIHNPSSSATKRFLNLHEFCPSQLPAMSSFPPKFIDFKKC